jgi:ABC-type uncharacterized transport system involved in gliding motility auxiliary subunit
MLHLKKISATALMGLLGLAFLAGLCVLAAKANLRLDLTANQRYSLTPQTMKVLDGLSAPVKAVAFFLPQEPGRDKLKDVLDLYARASGKFTYEFVDPDRDPFRAKEMKVTQNGEVVLLCGDKQEKVSLAEEEKLTNALIRVTDATRPKVYLVQGHGELVPDRKEQASAGILKEELEKQGAAVDKLTLVQDKDVPADAGLVLVLGPTKDFFPAELEALSRYLSGGGRVFVALDAQSSTNLDGWLKDNANIRRLPGLILDPVSRVITGNYLSPVMQDYLFAPIVKDFKLLSVFPTATALEAAGNPRLPRPQAIGTTSERSWLETDLKSLEGGKAKFDQGADTPGPLWLAAVFEGKAPDEAAPDKTGLGKPGQDKAGDAAKPGKRPGRLVAFGDQDFLSDKYIGLAGNIDLARNCMNWLLARENLISIAKPKTAQALLFPSALQNVVLVWVPLLVMPGIVLAMAVLVMVKRGRNKQA